MSQPWKACLPREAPKPGHAHVVVTCRDENGFRQEFAGQLKVSDAEVLMLAAINLSRGAK